MTAVSVVIPTFNRAEWVKNAVNSVLEQTFQDFEIIVVDDGSTDHTRSNLECFEDSRVTYIFQENSGLASARNTGIQSSRGEMIAFLDDDDFWFPDYLGLNVDQMDKDSTIGLSAGGWIDVDETGTPISQSTPWTARPELNDVKMWLHSCPVIPSAVVVKRKWIDQVGGFDEQLSRQGYGAEDYDLWLRLVNAGCNMRWVKENNCAYRIHQRSMSHNILRQCQGIMIVINKFFQEINLTEEIYNIRNEVIAKTHLRSAAREYGNGLSNYAKQDVAQAVSLNPVLLKTNGELLYDALLGWVGNPQVCEPYTYVKQIFNNLPDEAKILSKWKNKAIARAAKVTLFNSYFRKDPTFFRKALLLIVINDPVLLYDRGVFSILLYFTFGPKITNLVKKRYSLKNGTS